MSVKYLSVFLEFVSRKLVRGKGGSKSKSIRGILRDRDCLNPICISWKRSCMINKIR